MTGFRRCKGCGRRLTDVLFCTQCGGWFCCSGCLADDNDSHRRAKADSVNPARTCGADVGPFLRHTVMLRVVSTSGQDGRLHFKRIESHETHVGQQSFQVVHTHRLGEVGVEARFL